MPAALCTVGRAGIDQESPPILTMPAPSVSADIRGGDGVRGMMSDEQLARTRTRLADRGIRDLDESDVRALLDEVDRLRQHTVTVQHDDGTTSRVCDHTFHGTSRCVYCGKAFSELRREMNVEVDRLRQHNRHDALGALDEAAARASTPAPELRETVAVTMGPALRARVDALVEQRLIGDSVGAAVQTMFILGLLEAEGMQPESQVGAVQSHVSIDATYISFAIPHDTDTPHRNEVLRDLFTWLHAWLGDEDPLAAAPAAALEVMNR